MEKEKYEQIKENVQNIEINIYTNIKGEEKKSVLFTRSLLKNIPSNNYISLSDTPFFVTNYQIPYDYIKKLSLEEKISILFNKQLFTQAIFKNQDPEFSNKTDNPDENIEDNIKIILKLLFPTYYPVKGNHTDTYSELIQQKLPNTSDFSSYLLPITSVINNITKKEGKLEGKPENSSFDEKTTEFSYLNIGGKVYTILKVVYLNDFINNTKYKVISSNFFIFNKWKEKKNEEIDRDIIKMKNQIIELMNKLTYELNVPHNKCDIYKQLQKQYLSTDDLKNYRSISENYRVKNDNIEILLKYLEEIIFNNESHIDLQNSKTFIRNLCDNENIVGIKNNINQFTPPELTSKINNLQKLTNIKWKDDLSKIKQTFDTNYSDIYGLITSHPTIIKNLQDTIGYLNKYKDFFNTLIGKLEKIEKDKLEREKKGHEINNIYDKQIRNKKLDVSEEAELNTYKAMIDTKYTEYLEFLNEVTSIYTSSNASLQFTSVFNNRFSTINSIFKKLKIIIKIKSTYFENEINILQETSDEIKKYFEENYKEYNNFIQIIKKFLIPNRESNNKNIVDMISKYVSGDVKDLTTFLTNISKEEIENYKDTLHTIYDELHNLDGKKSKYEIQVYVDLIEGKLTKSILKNIGCYFKDNELVNLYYKRLYKNKYANKYEFNGKIPVLKIEELNASPDKVKQPPEKMGGQKKSKRMKIYRQKCKKCRFTRKSSNMQKY